MASRTLVAVERGTAEECRAARVRKIVRFTDPAGFSHELFYGQLVAHGSFRPGRGTVGFVTSGQGLGHVVLVVPDLAESLDFFCTVLGFKVSDEIDFEGNPLVFLHVNPLHHSLAIMGIPGMRGMHHLMLQVEDLDDVGLAHDPDWVVTHMQRPDLVENLVLMGSAGMPAPPGPALAAIGGYDFTVEGMRRVIAALANPHYTATDDQLKYRYELSVQPAVRAAYTAINAWIREHGGLTYRTEQIEQVKTRTLVVHGKDDQVVPVAHAYRFLELLENSSGYIIPNCRHWAMIEYPELFSAVVLDFLDGYHVDAVGSATSGTGR